MGAARERRCPEQVVNLPREIEVLTANGKSLPEACKAAGIVEQSHYRWRRMNGGMKHDEARRFRELETENARLKRVVADLSLREAMLQEVVKGNFWCPPAAALPWTC